MTIADKVRLMKQLTLKDPGVLLVFNCGLPDVVPQASYHMSKVVDKHDETNKVKYLPPKRCEGHNFIHLLQFIQQLLGD